MLSMESGLVWIIPVLRLTVFAHRYTLQANLNFWNAVVIAVTNATIENTSTADQATDQVVV